MINNALVAVITLNMLSNELNNVVESFHQMESDFFNQCNPYYADMITLEAEMDLLVKEGLVNWMQFDTMSEPSLNEKVGKIMNWSSKMIGVK